MHEGESGLEIRRELSLFIDSRVTFLRGQSSTPSPQDGQRVLLGDCCDHFGRVIVVMTLS